MEMDGSREGVNVHVFTPNKHGNTCQYFKAGCIRDEVEGEETPGAQGDNTDPCLG
eukprot:CAMPEP_0117685720 /NCGR_PEP_ID=MMETSP0804-20121206/21943_1 /TAXON_ID=1074897 /ORGANISM="Tetraselmis astigmatica, Strain CCMP880" /LENGTH=54 /DNA_ID=CAMNT_0005497117 /DNA_START=36 /DNA_END=196 /DNA_ORIENTATION=+